MHGVCLTMGGGQGKVYKKNLENGFITVCSTFCSSWRDIGYFISFV
jgi:hypothetical protein